MQVEALAGTHEERTGNVVRSLLSADRPGPALSVIMAGNRADYHATYSTVMSAVVDRMHGTSRAGMLSFSHVAPFLVGGFAITAATLPKPWETWHFVATAALLAACISVIHSDGRKSNNKPELTCIAVLSCLVGFGIRAMLESLPDGGHARLASWLAFGLAVSCASFWTGQAALDGLRLRNQARSAALRADARLRSVGIDPSTEIVYNTDNANHSLRAEFSAAGVEVELFGSVLLVLSDPEDVPDSGTPVTAIMARAPHTSASPRFPSRGPDPEPDDRVLVEVLGPLVHGNCKRMDPTGNLAVSTAVAKLGLRPFHSDATGDLYRIAGRDQDTRFVRVLDPAGTDGGEDAMVRWLAVPPYVLEAREGVAWSYGLRMGSYAPTLEG